MSESLWGSKAGDTRILARSPCATKPTLAGLHTYEMAAREREREMREETETATAKRTRGRRARLKTC